MLSRVGVYAHNHQFAAGFFWRRAAQEEVMGGSIGLSSGRLVKRACGLCVCLTGALIEVRSLSLGLCLILFTPM